MKPCIAAHGFSRRDEKIPMHIETLTLKNFRNYENLALAFSPGVNFIIGENGTGKTNILEAISVVANIKSFRNIHDREIIRWGEQSYHCAVTAGDFLYKRFEIGCSGDSGAIRKKAKIDGAPVGKTGDYFGKLLTVIFSPIDIGIIDDVPEYRRKFFDGIISKTDAEYFEVLSGFKKILMSRNRLLKYLKTQRTKELSQLDVWDQMFAEKASAIIQKRLDFTERFTKTFTESYRRISGEDLYPEIRYRSTVRDHGSTDIAQSLEKTRERDIILGYTGIGPQRDDYVFQSATGKIFSDYASQGQKRTAAVSLKLSECEILESLKREKCILLVDDIFSELDSTRRANLIAGLKGGNQVIFTMVHAGVFHMNEFASGKKFTVDRDARVREI